MNARFRQNARRSFFRRVKVAKFLGSRAGMAHAHASRQMHVEPSGTPFRPSRTAPCEETPSMNLVLWLPALFALGLVGMAACGAFLEACEKI